VVISVKHVTLSDENGILFGRKVLIYLPSLCTVIYEYSVVRMLSKGMRVGEGMLLNM
jgi:hypothetical protein